MNFSYHAAVALGRGELYCAGWGNAGCSTGNGNLPSLYLPPIYDPSDTQISLDPQANAMNYLVGQIIRVDPNAQIDIVGYSLGGVIAALYGVKYKGNSHIHSIITLESPLGGIFLAKTAVDGGPVFSIASYVLKTLSIFNTEVLRSLQIPGTGV